MVTGGIPGCEGLADVGSDGDASVLRAWQPAFNRTVAVRLLPHSRIEDLEADARRSSSLAGHPNVATVHDLGVNADGVPYLVTEFFECGSLADRLEREGAMDWSDAASVVVKVAGVVEAARRTAATDVSVTPADVFLSRFGEPKVALFRRPPPADVTDADGLRSVLRSLLTAGGADLATYPAGVRTAATDRSLDVVGVVRRLQQAQDESGQPVTDMPAEARREAAPTSPRPENFSELVTVAPPAPAPAGSARQRGPPAPFCCSARPSPRWPSSGAETRRPGPRRLPPRSPSPHARLTPTLMRPWPEGRQTSTMEAVRCLPPGAVKPQSSGSAPARAPELSEPFLLRMECVTDTSPTRASLFLNDVLLGRGEGTGSFPMDGVLIGTKGAEPYDVAIRDVKIHRLA